MGSQKYDFWMRVDEKMGWKEGKKGGERGGRGLKGRSLVIMGE